MFTKTIFETLPIAMIAAGIMIILLLHTLTSFFVVVLFIVAACISLFRRLKDLGTNPDVMDYIDPNNTESNS